MSNILNNACFAIPLSAQQSAFALEALDNVKHCDTSNRPTINVTVSEVHAVAQKFVTECHEYIENTGEVGFMVEAHPTQGLLISHGEHIETVNAAVFTQIILAHFDLDFNVAIQASHVSSKKALGVYGGHAFFVTKDAVTSFDLSSWVHQQRELHVQKLKGLATQPNKIPFSFNSNDDNGSSEKVHGYIEEGSSVGISVHIDGYSDHCSNDDNGTPIYIEKYNNELRLVAFGDINQEDHTHLISLEGASINTRNITIDNDHTQITSLEPIDAYVTDCSEKMLVLEGKLISPEVANSETVNYRLVDREEQINNLISWLAEASNNSDKLAKMDVLHFLMNIDDEYVFSQISTNEFISPTIALKKFNDICEQFIAEQTDFDTALIN
ncbi:MAG: hypothetical protein HAW67_01150 [Endozoicomonadaceae bacterium]|nr:hypothetical protein [Endozoicomonadaceae bacterium]